MPTCPLDRLELDLHLLAELEVEGAERLVEEEHAGPVDEGAGQRDALALPTGELRGPAGAEAGEPHVSSDSLRAAPALRLRPIFLTRRPYSTFSRTLMCGNSA